MTAISAAHLLVSTVPIVCLWPRRGFEWTADFLVPPSQVAPCLSHELDDQLNLLHAHQKNKTTLIGHPSEPSTYRYGTRPLA